MPKVVLRNTKTGKDEEFEPVDAREILSQEDTIYAPPKGDKSDLGTPEDISVPQYQGEDAEMQVGLSVDKYGRSNVVKALPGNPERTVTPAVVKETQQRTERAAEADRAKAKSGK